MGSYTHVNQLARAGKKDGETLNTIIKELDTMLRAIHYKYVRLLDEDDVLQELRIKLVDIFYKYNPEKTAKFSTYAYCALRNKAIDIGRSSSRNYVNLVDYNDEISFVKEATDKYMDQLDREKDIETIKKIVDHVSEDAREFFIEYLACGGNMVEYIKRSDLSRTVCYRRRNRALEEARLISEGLTWD